MSAHGGQARPLAGVHVLVTRPAHQAQTLCRMVEQAGGTALTMPLLDILPPQDPALARAALAAAADQDWAIFTSVNAVTHAAVLAPPDTVWPAHMAAVGRASARALESAGFATEVLVPAGGYSSEHLLAEPALQAIGGSRVLLVGGEGGRQRLETVLSARGARVTRAAVYRRRPAVVESARFRAVVEQTDVAVVTSAGALEHFLGLAGTAATRAMVLGLQLVVPSDRVLKKALDWGFRRTPWVPARVSDADIIATLAGRIAGDGHAGAGKS